MSAVTFIDGGVTAPEGFLASGVHCGIKNRRKDLALIGSVCECDAAALYTTNRVKAAPIIITKDHLSKGKACGAVINSGLANALTGKRGLNDAHVMAELAGFAMGSPSEKVVVASTGMIGKYLPMNKICKGIEAAGRALGSTRKHAHDAAMAIMTTDTVPKEEAVVVVLKDGTRITIGGMSKGSGMICPELKKFHATNLTFITTDAAISSIALEEMLTNAVEHSLNMLNIDGDRSTNDMCLILANGKAGNKKMKAPDPLFQEALNELLQSLTRKLAGDGEGAKKRIEVKVIGAKDHTQAKIAARSVVMSNLVKSAIFGEDPNFGRIVSAIGQSGVEIEADKVSLALESEYGSVDLMTDGKLTALVDDKTYKQARQLLKSPRIKMTVNLALGDGEATAWGCDLTYDYVRINAEYTT
jgi:glutamate N-acetyltransferase/amino-acid N-acetyltransferase